MSEENTQKLAQSLIGIYSMIYGAIEHKATKKGLQMPVCLEPDDAKNMDFENIFCLQEMVDSMKILLDFVKEKEIVNAQTKQNAEKFLAANKDTDSPAMNLVNQFMQLMKSLKVAIKNKELATEYEEVIQASEDAIAAILAERSIIEKVALKIEAGGFPIDARKLVRNFLNASKRDADSAYEILITNPAYFSPLILKGKMSMWRKITGKGPKMPEPEVGQKINRELAKFLKNLKF